MTAEKKINLQVKEQHLLAMAKAFADYQDLIKPIAEDQPQFKALDNAVEEIKMRILKLNKIIHRKYDNIGLEEYLKIELESLKLYDHANTKTK